MSTSRKQWSITEYKARDTQYSQSDFRRQDASSDSGFYSAPRFVTHIDDAAIRDLRDYYDSVLPKKGKILDFCSSWVSHYPESVENATQTGDLQIIGLGMNKAELDANKVLNSGRLIVDLNENPNVVNALKGANVIGEGDEDKLDASTNVGHFAHKPSINNHIYA